VLRTLAAAGAFLVSMDSLVNIAFPAMAAAFAAPPERMRWVIIAYVLTYALMSFVGGAAGDRFGHGRVFTAGLALSALAFAVCGSAPTLGWLLVGRVVQGFAGGLVYGTTPALVTLDSDAVGRGRALGYLNAAIALGFALGPLLAGVLVERFGWTAVFHVRVPLALVTLGWAVMRLGRAQARVTSPLIGWRDLMRPGVLGIGALAFLSQAGIFAIWLLAPFYLIERRGFSAPVGGVLFMLMPLGTAAGAPPAGRAADRLGPWAPMAGGLALEMLGLAAMAGAGPTTPTAVLALALFTAGLGVGLFQAPNMAALMAQFSPGQQGAAGGFAFLSRTLGIAAGVALLAEIFAWHRRASGFEAGFELAFIVATGLVAVAALAALARTAAQRLAAGRWR
jgi:MFS family permease